MGAQLTEQRAEGRNVAEAYRIALEEATSYYGTQDGYSGAINSKDRSYIVVTLPPRMTYRKLSDVLYEYEDARDDIEDATYSLRNYSPTKAQAAKLRTRIKRATAKRDRLDAKYPSLRLDSLLDRYNDKWGPPLAVELRPSEAKPSRRGRRVYVFFGYAPS